MAGVIALLAKPGSDNRKHAVGDLWLVHGTWTFDSSYPTGGEPIDATFFDGLFGSEHTILEFVTAPPTDGANYSTYDRANGKVKLFTADGTEAANASDQSTVVHRFIALIG